MNKLFFTFSLSVVISLLCSCGKNHGNVSEVNGIAFDSIVVDTVAPLFDGADSAKATIHLDILYAKGKMQDKINASILKAGILVPDYMVLGGKSLTFKQNIDTFVTKYISDYRADFGEIYKQEPKSTQLNVEYTVNTSVSEGKGGVINYIASIYQFSGGMHGTTQTIVKNIDSKTGKLLTLQDFFVPGYEEGLNKLILDKLTDMFKVKDLEGLKQQSIFADDNVYAPDNFIVNKKSVTFIYCEDEIAPHALGEIRVEISNSDLSDILKK
jgi:hypothetical protein